MSDYIPTADDREVAIHEAAHAVAFHLCGVPVRTIALVPIGAPPSWGTGSVRRGYVQPCETVPLAADLIATHAGPEIDAKLGCYDTGKTSSDYRFTSAQIDPMRDAACRVAVWLLDEHRDAIDAVAADLIASACMNGYAELGRRAARQSLERHAGELGLYDPDLLIVGEMTEAEQQEHERICAELDRVRQMIKARRSARRAMRREARSVSATDAGKA